MKNAVDYFHKEPEKLNCAQSILKAWQEDFEISDETIEEFRQWGGGRAEGGVCGALLLRIICWQKKEKNIRKRTVCGKDRFFNLCIAQELRSSPLRNLCKYCR